MIRPFHLALAVASAAFLLPGPALGAEQLSLQAQATNGGWTLPAPGPRSAVCLVDTGLDRAQTDVRSDVVATTIAGISSSGPAVTSGGPQMHGTWMVQFATAPQDGVGMIGPSPGVPVILVRAYRDNTTGFTGEDYAAGMVTCKRSAMVRGWNLAAIGLALGGDGASEADRRYVQDVLPSVSPAVVFAAVGNRAGIPQFPASVSGVIGIAAGSTVDGARCSTSADPDAEAGGVIGPGCLVTMPIGGAATPVVSAGTSGASIAVAAATAQVCDLAPTLSPQQCWQRLQDTARAVPGGKFVDLRAAAASLGLTAPAVTVEKATLLVPTQTPSPDQSSNNVIVGPPGGETTIIVSTPPSWYSSGKAPKIRRLASGRIRVTSPAGRKAELWTDLRGAKTGRRTSTVGKLRAGRKTVKIRVREWSAEGLLFERRWTLKPSKRKPKL